MNVKDDEKIKELCDKLKEYPEITLTGIARRHKDFFGYKTCSSFYGLLSGKKDFSKAEVVFFEKEVATLEEKLNAL